MRASYVALAILAVQSAAPTFEPVQPELFAAGAALTNAWADYDGDGDLDLFVGFGGTSGNRLYQNDKGTFRDVAAAAGVADQRGTRAAAWSDFDGDGDADLLVGFAPGGGSVLRLYRNDGRRFSDITQSAGLTVDSAAVRQPVFLDLDVDGDVDLFMAYRDKPNALYRNDGGHFTDIAPSIGLADPRRSVGALWFDYDEDGDLDLYVANQDGDANGLFRNDAGRFTDVAEAAGVAWGGRTPSLNTNGTVRPCAADVNNDGHLDLFMANYGKNGLYLNRGGGRFEDASEAWGVATDGRYDTCAFADFDHDGRIDLYVNGTVTGGTSYRDYLFRNTGSRMEDVTPANLLAFHASHGAQWADFDGDGDLDLAIAGTRPDATHSLLRNQLAPVVAQRSLKVRVIDERTRHGRMIAGAEVRAYRTGTRELVGMRLVDTGSGYNSQNLMAVHLGLPGTTAVDVEVAFPGTNGRRVGLIERVSARDLTVRVGSDGRVRK